MKNALVFLLPSLLLLTSQSPAESPGCQAGTYEIHGAHSTYGPFKGNLVVDVDGKVQRLVTFDQPLQNRLRSDGSSQDFLQELWEGRCENGRFLFRLKTSHTLSEYNGLKPDKTDFQFQNLSLSNENDFSLRLDGDYHEKLLFQSSATTELFTADQKVVENSTGHTEGLVSTLAKSLGISQLLKYYRSIDAFAESRNRPEFKQAQQYTITDFNDFDFYRKEKTTLRIRNLSLNPLSIAEARQRRLTFAFSFKEKANFKQWQTANLNMNEMDSLGVAFLNEQGTRTSIEPEGDSTLWTAMYLWSQYTRYEVTKDEDAYQQFKKALNGLVNMMKISNDPHLFARFIVKSPASETLDPNLRQGTGEFADYKWHPRSNNDMTKGLLIGFALAYMGLEERDSALRTEIATFARRLLKVEAVTSNSYNRGMAYGLDALWNHDQVSAENFVHSINNVVNGLADSLHISSGFYVGGSEDSSGIHLSTISTTVQLLIAREMAKRKEFRSLKMDIEYVRRAATKNLLESVARLPEAHHEYINIFAYALTGEKSIRSIAQKSVSILNEVPIRNLYERMHVDLTNQPDWCYSAWPRYAWKNIKGPFMIDKKAIREDVSMFQGAYSYPLYESSSISSTYLWKDGNYSTWHHKQAGETPFASDYLLAYWLARKTELISAED